MAFRQTATLPKSHKRCYINPIETNAVYTNINDITNNGSSEKRGCICDESAALFFKYLSISLMHKKSDNH